MLAGTLETPFGFSIEGWEVEWLFEIADPYIKNFGEEDGFNRLIADNSEQQLISELGFDVCWALLYGSWENNYYDWHRGSRRKRRYVKSKHIKEQWEARVEQYNGRCFYCGRETKKLTRDHIIPIKNGGDDGIENIVPACMKCNRKKGTKPLSDFKEGAMLKLI